MDRMPDSCGDPKVREACAKAKNKTWQARGTHATGFYDGKTEADCQTSSVPRAHTTVAAASAVTVDSNSPHLMQCSLHHD
jgi:hypothetical protein